MNWRANGESLSAAPASWNRLRLPCQAEKWMWVPFPAWSRHGFGASEAISPLPAATPRIVSRASTCWSAAVIAGDGEIEISCWPWPSSA